MSDRLLREIERKLAQDPLLREVIHRTLPGRAGRADRWSPEADVLDLDDRAVLLLDVPGVAREDLSVTLDGPKLIVSGRRSVERPPGARIRAADRPSGPFRREFLLPASADGARVTARLDAGVLRIEIPRPLGARTVDIEEGDAEG